MGNRTPDNDDPSQPWNDPRWSDNPGAPHNGFDADNPFKPWNSPFGRKEQLTDKEAEKYGIRRRRDDPYEEHEKF